MPNKKGARDFASAFFEDSFTFDYSFLINGSSDASCKSMAA